MVRPLVTDAEISGFKTVGAWIFKTLSAHPAGNEYSGLFRAGKGEFGEEEESDPISANPLSGQLGSVTATSS